MNWKLIFFLSLCLFLPSYKGQRNRTLYKDDNGSTKIVAMVQSRNPSLQTSNWKRQNL